MEWCSNVIVLCLAVFESTISSLSNSFDRKWKKGAWSNDTWISPESLESSNFTTENDCCIFLFITKIELAVGMIARWTSSSLDQKWHEFVFNCALNEAGRFARWSWLKRNSRVQCCFGFGACVCTCRRSSDHVSWTFKDFSFTFYDHQHKQNKCFVSCAFRSPHE